MTREAQRCFAGLNTEGFEAALCVTANGSRKMPFHESSFASIL